MPASPTPFLQVALDTPLRRVFDYLPPAGMDPARIEPGMRVLVPLGRSRVVGFVTEDHLNPRLFGGESEDIVAVYFPMSYQIGGYTLYLHKSELEETQLSVEEAMRMVLIGGVTSAGRA